MNPDSSDNSEGEIKILSLIIFKWDSKKPIILSSSLDLSNFPFFYRNSIKEKLIIGTKWIVSQATLGSRYAIDFDHNLGRCHVRVDPSGLCSTTITSPSYPMRVAFGLLDQSIMQFQEHYNGKWEGKTEDVLEGTMFKELGNQLLNNYKNPSEADKILKVQKSLDEVKDIMKQNIEEFIKRGENLDSLLQSTDDLTKQANAIFKEAKRANQCCKWY